MTSSVAELWLWSERGRLSRKEVAGRDSEREKGQRKKNKGESHEATGPSAFSLAVSMHEWGPGRLGEA